AAMADAQTHQPARENLLAALEPKHPRLMVTPEDVDRTRQLVKSDETARGYLDDLYRRGGKMLDEPPVERVLEGPRLLEQSRKCLNRVYTLGALYRIDGDRKWLDRAVKEMEAAAAFVD